MKEITAFWQLLSEDKSENVVIRELVCVYNIHSTTETLTFREKERRNFAQQLNRIVLFSLKTAIGALNLWKRGMFVFRNVLRTIGDSRTEWARFPHFLYYIQEFVSFRSFETQEHLTLFLMMFLPLNSPFEL